MTEMASGFFVTATDTSAGKTVFSCALLSALARRGFSVAGFKPVAAGAVQTPVGLRNEDAALLRRHSSISLDYEEINPITLEPPIAPHIAARSAGISLSPDLLAERHRQLAGKADIVISEGAGGWLVPLSETENMADLAVRIGDPVILVVAMRLGCLNHALLTAESIRARGANFAGWVANRVDPEMPVFEENMESLDARLGVPRLATVPWLDEPDPERKISRAIAGLDLDLVTQALARA
ncbi:MAG: dethiobiotin synthase [Gammaproteobacteria bacterium]|jgi:dethiobiotin synthetase